ncbi:MAG: HDOD domain-containing protein [Sterolibacterium sp.]|nr:HDOD domain-containing protein [Sterolibacterium sp.]
MVRELGRGAQSVVYLCVDPHLQREVAIKTLHFSEADPRLSAFLLDEARAVSNLRHPNIVPIFEAGEQDGDPYLVFEYVAGDSLAQLIKRQAIEPLRVAEMVAAVLDALVEAHGQGIIHRDLKPSNILIDAKGAPRVMDFGIAVRVSEEGQAPQVDALMGTPPYLAPEYVRERVINEKIDIYAIGLILIEMLTGQRARQAASLPALLKAIADEPVKLPKNFTIDERMEGIILRAVAQDPALRFESAARMQEALREYIRPPLPEGDAEAPADGGAAAVDFLLRRMRHKSDFPALSDSISAINRLTHSDKESINKLSNSILKDYALTAKILRIVNSPVYRQSGGGAISTVSRAVMVLGFDTIRNVALTVMMFEHLQNKGNAREIKEAFLRANLSGLLGRDIGQKLMPRDAEEVFICSMFHGLGRLLVQFYFPDEVEEIRRLMLQRHCSDDAAVRQVLGTSFEELGGAIAKHWGFPPSVVGCMRRMPPGAVRKPATREDALHMVASYSNELCDSIANTAPEDRAKAAKQIAERYAAGVHFSDDQFKSLMQRACNELGQMASSLNVNLKQSPFARQAQAWSGGVQEADTPGRRLAALGVDADLAQTMLTDPGVPGREAVGRDAAGGVGGSSVPSVAVDESVAALDGEGVASVSTSEDVQATLAAGIQDISNSLVGDFALNDLLRIILETMYRAMGFERVLLCLRDAKTNQMVGRFGFGVDTNELARNFRFELKGVDDVFRVAALKGLDIIITDINDPKIHDRIPAWYRGKVTSETFVLFPLMMKGTPVAMIYCDRRKAGEIVIPTKELTLLKTLRNQAVLAIKQTT